MKKVLTFSLFALSVLLNFNAYGIMFRPPPPPDGYDERTSCLQVSGIADPNASIGLANIQEISTSHFGDVGSCYKIKYVATKNLIGTLPAEFELSACNKKLTLGTLMSNIAASTRAEGARRDINVLVGVVVDGPKPSDTHFLELGCQYFPHIRVETLPYEMQREIVKKLRTGSLEAQRPSNFVLDEFQGVIPTD